MDGDSKELKENLTAEDVEWGEETIVSISAVPSVSFRIGSSTSYIQIYSCIYMVKHEDKVIQVEITQDSLIYGKMINDDPGLAQTEHMLEKYYDRCWCEVFINESRYAFNWYGGYWNGEAHDLPQSIFFQIERFILDEHLDIFYHNEPQQCVYSVSEEGHVTCKSNIGSDTLLYSLKLRALQNIEIRPSNIGSPCLFWHARYNFRQRSIEHIHGTTGVQFDRKLCHLSPSIDAVCDKMLKLRCEYLDERKENKALKNQLKKKTKRLGVPLKSPCENLSFFIKKKRGEPYFFVVFHQENTKQLTKCKKITFDNIEHIPYDWILDSAAMLVHDSHVNLDFLTIQRIDEYVEQKKTSLTYQ